jgi:hypothetical protein
MQMAELWLGVNDTRHPGVCSKYVYLIPVIEIFVVSRCGQSGLVDWGRLEPELLVKYYSWLNTRVELIL